MTVKSVHKALSILKAVAQTGEGLTVQQVSEAVGLPYATAHRFVSTLVEEGFLQLHEDRKRYRVGPELLKLFGGISHQTHVGRQVYPYLAKLNAQTGETVHLAVRYGVDVVYLDTLVATSSFAMYTPVGTRTYLHCTALGKALLAFSSDAEINVLLSDYEFRRMTENTITSIGELWEEILKIRSRGYAVDMEEGSPGVRCVASIIINGAGRAEAAVSVSTPARRLATPEAIATMAEYVCGTCRLASRAIGGSPGPDPSEWYREMYGGWRSAASS